MERIVSAASATARVQCLEMWSDGDEMGCVYLINDLKQKQNLYN